MVRKSIFILLGIVILGFLLRFYKIWENPLYGDELTMVYDTYSIAKTGMDSTGVKLPLTFKMGSGRPGGYIYFSVPFVEILGPTVWGERALSLISGLGIIVLVYFLGKKLFNEKVGIIASFLMAISPWDIYLSRAGYEAHFALFLALAGILAFLQKKYIWWAIAWGLTVLTYPTFKLTLPILFLLFVFMEGYEKLLKAKFFIVGIVVLLFFAGITTSQTFLAGSEQRFLTQNIFADQGVKQSIIQRVDYERTISTLPKTLAPLFINQPIEYSRMLFENYVNNISPNFLILRGDGNPRQNPGEMGMIYIIDLPLIIIALTLLWREKRKEFALLFVWILITPLATMFFPEAHGLRNDLMIPPLILLVAYAFTKIPRRFVYVAAVLIFIQLAYILVRIYFISPAKFGSFWSAEAKSASLTAIQNNKAGKITILSTQKIDNIEYAYPVYAAIDPKLVISQYGKFPKVYGKVIIND